MNIKEIAKERKRRIKELQLRNEVMAVKREKTLWKWFSLYIRLRGCVSNGFGPCVTCGNVHYFKEMDCGHYIPQKNNYNTVYNENNTGLQCKNCNQYGHGEVEKYHNYLVDTIGEEEVEELHRLANLPAKKMVLCDIEAKSAYYRQKAKDEAYLQCVEI